MEAINDLGNYVEGYFKTPIKEEDKDWLNNLYHEYKTNIEEMSLSDCAIIMAVLKACGIKEDNK